MNYEQAKEQIYKVKWKVSSCFAREDCWCRIIEPEESITYTYGFDNEGNHLEESIILIQ